MVVNRISEYADGRVTSTAQSHQKRGDCRHHIKPEHRCFAKLPGLELMICLL
jgi:hypothetical protein